MDFEGLWVYLFLVLFINSKKCRLLEQILSSSETQKNHIYLLLVKMWSLNVSQEGGKMILCAFSPFK